MEQYSSNELLWSVCIKLSSDFIPFGTRLREWGSDCSCMCKHFKPIEGKEGLDWGVCLNPNSPRKGLLTFEHMGCEQYDYDEQTEDEDDL